MTDDWAWFQPRGRQQLTAATNRCLPKSADDLIGCTVGTVLKRDVSTDTYYLGSYHVSYTASHVTPPQDVLRFFVTENRSFNSKSMTCVYGRWYARGGLQILYSGLRPTKRGYNIL